MTAPLPETPRDYRPATEPARDRPLGGGRAVLAGAGLAVLGLLPWLSTGLILPLQNLWAEQTMPTDMPRAMLPFSQYHLLAVFGMIVMPGAVGGLVARGRRGDAARTSAWFGLGLALPVVAAAAQTLAVVVPGLRPGTASTVYVVAVGTAIAASLLVSLVVCRVLATGSRPVATVAVAAGALGVGCWLTAFGDLHPSWWWDAPPGVVAVVVQVERLTPAVLTGLALAWCGWTPVRRLAAWAGAIAVLWVGSAAMTALAFVAGSRALLGDPAEMLDGGVLAFRFALAAGWSLAVLAVVVGVVGRMALRRFRR